MPRTSDSRAGDRLLALCLLAGVALYLSRLPHNLGNADESYFLYEAKRIRDGQVMYRDIFEFVTPLSSYAMAGLFRLFGTTMATARIGMAFVHAFTAVALYASARRLAVRMEIAVLVPLAYVALCVAVWPFASWHWFSTSFIALLLLAALATPWADRPRWALVPGIVAGLLIGTQQQKGVVLAAGMGVVVLADFALDRLYPDPESPRQLARRLAYFAAGIAAVVVPLLLAFVRLAGTGPLYEALIRFPLDSYRPAFHIGWGRFIPLAKGFAAYTYPPLLEYCPLALVLPLARLAWEGGRRGDRERVRRLTVLIVLSAFSAASIWYYPDLIHVAFIAGVFWVAAAESLEWVVSAARPAALSRLAGLLVLTGAGSGLALHLAHYRRTLKKEFPISHRTAFGVVDFAAGWEADMADEVRRVLGETPSRTLFCYPQIALPYLVSDGRNPTPYQFLSHGVSPPYQIRDALRTLQRQRVRYVVASVFLFRPGDPLADYITEHYQRVFPQIEKADIGKVKELPTYFLYRRKGEPGEGRG